MINPEYTRSPNMQYLKLCTVYLIELIIIFNFNIIQSHSASGIIHAWSREFFLVKCTGINALAKSMASGLINYLVTGMFSSQPRTTYINIIIKKTLLTSFSHQIFSIAKQSKQYLQKDQESDGVNVFNYFIELTREAKTNLLFIHMSWLGTLNEDVLESLLSVGFCFTACFYDYRCEHASNYSFFFF